MAKFDTRVQELRYEVVKAVAKHLFDGDFEEKVLDIPKEIIPGPKPTMRCCIYKERAIVEERIKLTLHNSFDNTNVINVIPIACDECPLGGYTVTDQCRGCIAHRCYNACPKKCISFDDNLRAHIDKSSCVNCGMCAKSCPYEAIENKVRPCEKACKMKAISPSNIDNSASINYDNCIQCGACVYTCPFGAIVDESYIKQVINLLKDSENNKKYQVYAVVAPSIGANFYGYKTGQVISAIKKLGFYRVAEAALGADMVALKEAHELEEKQILTSSCCPAFVTYIKKNYPTLVDKISSTLSPMAMISKTLKEHKPGCKVVFIGPCTAKKQEIRWDSVRPYVDSCLTFEELQALIDAKGIDVKSLPESHYEYGSGFGRGFAKCGGLTIAVNQALKESNSDFVAKGVVCDGIDNIKLTLNKLKTGTSDFNFVEGMACVGGCIGGPCNLTHEVRDKIMVDKFSTSAESKTISEAIKAAGVIDKDE